MDDYLLREGIAKWRFESFIDPDLLCPTLIVLSLSGWRDGIDSICKIIAWCDGAARRIKQSSDLTGLKIVWLKLQQDVFEQLKFTLAQRVEWEDSYAIPEAVFPFIYQHLTNLITDIFPEHLDYLLSFIEERFSFQCGLYSEGFRLTLTNILNQLTSISLDADVEDKAFLLTERWRDFVLKNLKNRHELVPELLIIIPLFVRLNALEEAQRTYQSVLAYSMGPSWYKEDQFSLMITALKSINTDLSIGSGALSQIAALLDEASGEMTFQRFVRYAKRDFIGALCERGDFVNTVSFFIRQTYGTSEQLYKEGTQGIIDRVSELRGSRYPGGALDEQDSIWRIVKSTIPIADWSLCWTLLEIFQFGDLRHLDRYAEAYALLIQKAQEDSNVLGVMMKRLELICESEVEKKQCFEFISSFKRHLPFELNEQFENLFRRFSNSEKVTETKPAQSLLDPIDDNNKENVEEQVPGDALLMPGTFGTRDAIQDAKNAFSNAERHLRRHNQSEALKEILSGLKNIQNGGWPIWTGQVKEVSQGLQLLLKITTSPSEIVKLCSSIITSERYADIWLIADSLIEEFASYANHDEQSALVKLAIEHTEIMVGVSDEHIQNHVFLENAQDIDASSSLIKLIVHAIDHPSWLRSEKAADMLLWLLRNHPQYIPTFAPKAFSMDSSNHPDVLCGIFEQLSRSDSKGLWDHLSPALDFEKIKKDCKHVGRLSVLMRLASRAAQRGSDSASSALILLQENIFDPMSEANVFQETMIECPSWAKCIDFQWSKLKKQGLLSPKLLERAIAVMKELSSPYSLETNLELEQLLIEGVGGNSSQVGRWKAKVSFAFQVALLPITTKSLFPQIEAIFRSYNPTRLDQMRVTNFKSPAIDWLAQLKKTHETIKPINGKDIYLDFYERIWFEGSWKMIRFTAYFYANGENFPLPSGRFLSTEEQTTTNTSPWDTCVNVRGFPAYFGSFTPAVPTSNLMQSTQAKHTDLTRAYWKSGRVAESFGGGPEHEGCYLAINKNALQLPLGIKLGWVYELDGKAIAMVTLD